LASLVGAILTGVGGARWLTSELDKNLLRAAAAAAQPSAAVPRQIADENEDITGLEKEVRKK